MSSLGSFEGCGLCTSKRPSWAEACGGTREMQGWVMTAGVQEPRGPTVVSGITGAVLGGDDVA